MKANISSLPSITSLKYFAHILYAETFYFIRNNYYFSPKAALLNFNRNEADPVLSAAFGHGESRKFGKVFQSTLDTHLVVV